MATKVRIELDHDGFGKLLTSEPLRDLLDRKAEEMASAAGDGFETRSWTGKAGMDTVFGTQRHMASVWTADYASRYAESTDKALSKAVGL